MSHGIAIPHHRPAGHGHHLVLSVLLVALVGGLGLAIVGSAVDAVRGAFAEETATSEPRVEFAARELPREWQWQPSGVAVEHMYGQHKPARLDWIREGGAR
jgi:hypothetical protein